jgi:UDP-galactopyranose mutase
VNKKKTPGYTTKKVLDSPVFEKEYDNCIVGAGLSGSVIAENYATLLGQTSLILEKRHHIAGNCYDYIDEETGLLVSLFGAHLFHTKHERVWEYVQRFSKWVPYEHKVLGMVNGKIVPIPVTIDTVNILFDMNITNSEEMDEFMKKERVPLVDEKGKPREAKNSEEVALATVGKRLYDLIFKPYTLKQWAKYPGTCVKIDYSTLLMLLVPYFPPPNLHNLISSRAWSRGIVPNPSTERLRWTVLLGCAPGIAQTRVH